MLGVKPIRAVIFPSLANPNDEPSAFEYATSSYYVQDGSFLKLKNFQIGYNLPTQKIVWREYYFQQI
ncbi:TonB-linked outer membrane protein, SusC/RagA family [Sphingobacterium daejeonense]|nr:TonB-linked outer membrane protein, SusC/RagA family [Sphingobacterium daejeonense]